MASGRHSVGGVSGVTATRPAAAGAWQQTRPTRAEARRAARAAGTSGPFAFAGVAALAVAAAGGLVSPGASGGDLEVDTAASFGPDRRPSESDPGLSALRTNVNELSERASRAEARRERRLALERRRKRLEALLSRFSLPLNRHYILTAGFGQSGSRWSSNHTGQDFSVPTGTPVHAVAAGTITEAGWDHFYGWHTVIRHQDGTETWYCHLSQFKRRSGQVRPGEVIALSGNTGNSSGPHLHFEVRRNNSPVNPMPWLRRHGLNP